MAERSADVSRGLCGLRYFVDEPFPLTLFGHCREAWNAKRKEEQLKASPATAAEGAGAAAATGGKQ